ncbi:MAG: hypothetical protein ACRDJO_06170 [Actinomycetota bacterium]
MRRYPAMEPQRQEPDVVLVPGPLESAWSWVATVVESGDLAAAWPHTDPNLRLVLAQSWIFTHRTKPPVSGWNREELARGLVPVGSRHPLWAAFAARQVEKLRAWWGNPNLDEWGASIKGRVMAADHELIRFTPIESRPGRLPRPSSKGGGHLVLVRAFEEQWLVAGFDRNPPRPGWPPQG